MARLRYSLAAAFTALVSLVNAQAGPNTLAVYNPANRTTSVNGTFCVLPIPKNVVTKLTKGHAPLDLPKDVFPSFPEGMHPLLLQFSYQNDIRMTPLNLVPLQIPALMQGALTVLYTDVTKDGKTAINVPINYYLGGINGQDLQTLVPAIVGAIPLFEGTIASPAETVPDTEAVQSLGNGQYSVEVKPFLLPNPLSGPGVVAEAFDLTYSLTTATPYTPHTFHSFLNNPLLLDSGKCQRQGFYFNETFANPKMAIGTATLYNQPLFNTPAKEIAGVYKNVYCYQANAETVSNYIGEDCSVADARIDPFSRE